MAKNHIRELSKKLIGLARLDVVAPSGRGMAGLSKFTGIDRNALRPEKHNDELSEDDEHKLAVAFGYIAFHENWRGCDAEEFLGNLGDYCIQETTEQTERPISADDSLVVVEMFLEQPNKDSTLVFIELRCRDAVLGTDELTESRRIAIQRGVLRLDCEANGHAATTMNEAGRERADWFAKSGKFILETADGKAVTIRGTGSSQNMVWSIDAAQGDYLDDVELNEPHCQVVDLMEGDSLTATFETFPKNLSFVLIEEETGTQEVLTRNHQKIIDHMEKQALCQGQQKGSAIFSRHSRIFRGVATRK